MICNKTHDVPHVAAPFMTPLAMLPGFQLPRFMVNIIVSTCLHRIEGRCFKFSVVRIICFLSSILQFSNFKRRPHICSSALSAVSHFPLVDLAIGSGLIDHM